ncbi:MAG: hypothetical protein KIT14_05085 [bacterium]|nr:hypothetical protein [bacterium]
MIAAADLERLREALAEARRMVAEMHEDRLFPRLVLVLASVMPQDREALLRMLEHEVGARLLVARNGVWSRFALRANPYARIFQRPAEPPPTRSLAFDECMLAARAGARISLQLPPRSGPSSTATRRVWRGLSSTERAIVIANSMMLQDRLRALGARRRVG